MSDVVRSYKNTSVNELWATDFNADLIKSQPPRMFEQDPKYLEKLQKIKRERERTNEKLVFWNIIVWATLFLFILFIMIS